MPNPSIVQKNPHASPSPSPWGSMIGETYVYYLPPDFVPEEIPEDDEIFEMYILHCEDTQKYRLKDFERAFNGNLISDLGYILIR